MIRRRGNQNAFTLVELLIVVALLGVLAAIAIPKFAHAAEGAQVTNTRATLRGVRQQLEIYRLDHKGQYPALETLWDGMLCKTDVDGDLDPNGPFGPYLLSPPRNPFTNSVSVAAAGSAGPTDGWEYDEVSGVLASVGFDEATGVFAAPQ